MSLLTFGVMYTGRPAERLLALPCPLSSDDAKWRENSNFHFVQLKKNSLLELLLSIYMIQQEIKSEMNICLLDYVRMKVV